MFEEAVADKPDYVLPIVITFVGNFFLQDSADGNHGGKRVAEEKELQKELPA